VSQSFYLRILLLLLLLQLLLLCDWPVTHSTIEYINRDESLVTDWVSVDACVYRRSVL